MIVIPNDHGSKLLEPQIWLTNTRYCPNYSNIDPQQNEANAHLKSEWGSYFYGLYKVSCMLPWNINKQKRRKTTAHIFSPS